MANGGTKACKECLAEIPAAATRCQRCGVDQNRGRGLGQVVGALFILLIAFFVVAMMVKSWTAGI